MKRKIYKAPKDIQEEFDISPAMLKNYRLKGYLVDIKWSAGASSIDGKQTGKPYYEVGEIKKVFYK